MEIKAKDSDVTKDTTLGVYILGINDFLNNKNK